MTAESRFPTLAELVHHHSVHSDGLITQVREGDDQKIWIINIVIQLMIMIMIKTFR